MWIMDDGTTNAGRYTTSPTVYKAITVSGADTATSLSDSFTCSYGWLSSHQLQTIVCSLLMTETRAFSHGVNTLG
jgi:hypothetical protein